MKQLKDFLIGLFLVLWLLYPMTHLTCFDDNIWKFILWFNTSVIITVSGCRFSQYSLWSDLN